MNDILSAFQRKIVSNALTEQDFLKPGLFEMFYGKSNTPFVKTLADCKDPAFEQGEEKYIFHISMDDGWEVRMDFVLENGVYKLSDMDSYTLPLKKIDRFPFNCFEPLTEKQEARMREEYRITKMVNDFVRLKNIIGKEKALEWGASSMRVFSRGYFVPNARNSAAIAALGSSSRTKILRIPRHPHFVRYHPRREAWTLMEKAKGRDISGLIAQSEVEAWKTRTLAWYDKVDIQRYRPLQYLFLKDIESFMNDAGEQILTILQP